MALKFFGRGKTDPDESNRSSPELEPPEKGHPKGWARLLKRGLSKTRDAISAVLPFGRKLDEDSLEEIEAQLIQADFGPATASALTDDLRSAYKDKEFDREEIVPFLKERLVARLGGDHSVHWAAEGPTVILVAGVNGTGKTTSIAKLAHVYREEGKSVVLAAGDTFRAAAVEQLAIWSERLGVEMVKGKEGGDPAAVVYDAVCRAVDKKIDLVIADTAGRLHTQKNLMNQLTKVVRVIQKKIPDGPHEVLQVLDATTGQNAIQQAKAFHGAIQVTGLVLTKLDGTARGGVIFPILEEVGLPVKFVGVGEGLEHLHGFDPVGFVDALFESA